MAKRRSGNAGSGQTDDAVVPDAIESPNLRIKVEAAADPIVMVMLGEPLPEEEAVFWAALTPVKRKAAVRRLKALSEWSLSPGSLSVADAAAIADVSPNRFYRLAADWRRKKSIASLGVLATADRSAAARVAEEANATILSCMPFILRELDGASVRAQVARLREVVEPLLGKDLPGESRLRQYVEQARRRKEARSQVGNLLAFDCTACVLLREDGRPYVVFALIDLASGLIIGFQTGELARSAREFAAVADDTLQRMDTGWARRLPWAPTCNQIIAVVGGDGEQGRDLEDWHKVKKAAATRTNAGVNILLSTKARRQGQFFRKLIGPTIGRLVLASAAKADDRAPLSNGAVSTSVPDAMVTIEGEVARHNENVLRDMEVPVTAVPPPANLAGFLEMVVRDEAFILA